MMLTELMRAAGLVRRISTNIGQAIATLTATGQPAGDLPRYAAGSLRRADHIDAVADDGAQGPAPSAVTAKQAA